MLLEQNDINFSLMVEEEVAKRKDGYIDAIIALCDKLNLDPKYVAKHLSDPIKEKLQAEGQEINLLPKTSKLPF
tara:strand:+ start:3039 stop:3260 length:222 start_codon:yes stop_codon:yes gene_type:complete